VTGPVGPAHWTPPDRPEGISSSGAAVGSGPGHPSSSAVVRGDEPWSPLEADRSRPRPTVVSGPVGPGVVLDGGFELLRKEARLLIGLAACLYVPIRLLDLTVTLSTGAASERYQAGPALLLLTGDGAWSWTLVVLQSVALSLLGLCTGQLASRRLAGEAVSFGFLGSFALRRSWVAVVILPVSFVVRAPLSCIPLGFLLADALLFMSSVTAGAEGLGPVASVRRSMALARGAFGPVLVVVTGALVISQVLRISFYAGPVLLIGSFDPGDAVLAAVGQAGALVLLIAEPLTACIAARAYLDVRARREGLDLRLRLEDRFGPPGALA
jgi:hypothetical protein